MIRLAEIIKTFLPDLEQKYGHRLLPSHRQALTAIQQCRTQALGSAAIHCQDCDRQEVFPLSCGHRFCPQCQHEAGETWLERQRAKLLPVDYDLITFTLPATWRALVYDHQREAYDLLIRLAWQTLAAFGLRDKALHGDLGATVVLHTHSRALDFHPHVHVVLPAGAIDSATRHWNRKTGKFLFAHKALAKVFRAKWFAAMKELGWTVQADLPAQWVVNCKPVGNGDQALTYLGRYLDRGGAAGEEHPAPRGRSGDLSLHRQQRGPQNPHPGRGGLPVAVAGPCPAQRLPAQSRLWLSPCQLQAAHPAAAPGAALHPAPAQATATTVLQTVRGNGDRVDLPHPGPSEISGKARGGGLGDGDVTRATPSPPASGHSRPRGALGSKSGVFDAIPANIGRIEPRSGS